MDATDGRITPIYLMTRGPELRDELVPHAVAVNERNLARLGAEDGRTLLRLLAQLAHSD